MDWDRVGIEEIDREHAAIHARLGALAAAAAGGRDWCEGYAHVEALRELCAVHFGVEESLMRLHDFPGLTAHRDEHRRFSGLLSDLQRRVVSTPLDPGAIGFIDAWWTRHIRNADRLYVEWFVGRPVPVLEGAR